MVTCPVCGLRAIGKVGADQYYCWDCCVEFMLRGQDIKIFNVEADGSLSMYGNPMQVEANLQLQEG